ncbi:NAD(P)-binding protein [Zopfia rhizophila CBS 207.26]|uniref:NAD(P)-binding protein n=1 Tax=Zopfia rhizophila CBS 207.26 TaxID=1314779 RepID=A0A6A6DLP5_9PEZI|nr:NAD(P)-binding protein [Zopfia rhizophila CBS 207.26]
MSNVLKNKVALVTGASSGIGRSIALGLASHGAKIVCCDLKEAANPAGFESDVSISTTSLIVERGGSAIFCQTDISQTDQLEKALERTITEYERLDMLVNCAGYWVPFQLFVDEDDETWAKMVAVNTLGTAKMSRLAIRQFLKQNVDSNRGSRGRIVNISSCAAVCGYPGEVAYSATKASINHMTRAAALDHARDYININCIAPGVVATGLARQNLEDGTIHQTMKDATPWPRLGRADDIGGVAVFLCLSESQWMTGQVLSVDGGITIGISPPH